MSVKRVVIQDDRRPSVTRAVASDDTSSWRAQPELNRGIDRDEARLLPRLRGRTRR